MDNKLTIRGVTRFSAMRRSETSGRLYLSHVNAGYMHMHTSTQRNHPLVPRHPPISGRYVHLGIASYYRLFFLFRNLSLTSPTATLSLTPLPSSSTLF